MNKIKFFGVILLVGIALYGVSSTFAQADDADTTDCPQDGSGEMDGNHYQRGAMDGSGIGDMTHAQDGSGIGGMFGAGDCEH